jgi:thioredoxin-like negative regulator of GroEL
LAKIDCEENEMAYEFENIQHFPTLVFYNKGEPLNFDGDRTKSYILKWLTKRLASPVREVSKEELEQLASSESAEVSLVFHGALESVKGATFINVAYQDNYNSKLCSMQITIT